MTTGDDANTHPTASAQPANPVQTPDETTTPAPEAAPTRLAPRILTIAIYTLLPIAGVLFFGWDWREVIILYWLENVALGVAMVIRMLRTIADPGTDPLVINGRPINPGPIAVIGMTIFFCFHYGLFTIGHGVFVFSIAAGAFSMGASNDGNSLAGPDALSLATIDWLGVFLVFAVGGLIQLAMAAFGPLGPKRGGALMMSAYPRIFVLHLTIIGGAFLIASLGWPPIAALLLIGMHGAVDAVAIVRANRAHREPAPV
ncbi:hypothetical protein EV140_0089 [Microcella alkaliphila]|uniref:Uncharacterized protein n=1 Tax=Microcella alkaliphila TaxID=279828 RepID=A0A4Q7TZN4_9MICO|nr:DUF6498-containing protein [Microcella alkaliphila]RZT66443.1 hypothetical protein EV140_0089 [Microcella alkaliphila]